MQFEYDIFISYSKKDNKPLSTNNNKGWVSSFHKFLETRLTQLLGQKPKFLHYANEEKPVASELVKSCILVSVVSPEYVNERDNIDDVEVFWSNAEKNGNLVIAGTERIFKVNKSPVSFEQQPSKLRSLLGYDMFEVDSASGDIKEINNFFNSEAEKNFWMKLDDLAHDIYDILKEVKVKREGNKKEYESVYLAETGYDLYLERDLIKRELQRHGYRVLPDHTLPTNVREMEAVIKRDLNECKLSIHLIGDSYGEIPEGSDKSIIDIQNQIAAEHCNMVTSVPVKGEVAEFNRLIWLSPAVKLTDEKQKIFIENLKRDAEKLSGAEVIQTPLEDLKNIIKNELLNEETGKPTATSETPTSGLPIVYLIYDSSDLAGGKEIADMLSLKGNEVLQPLFKGELLEVRNQHFDNLRKCDVALIYYGKVNQQWVQMKVLDVLKAPGLGRTKGELTKTIFSEAGHKLDIEKLKTQGISVIENKGGMHVSLEPFMAKINRVR